jgi:hypothetical protein
MSTKNRSQIYVQSQSEFNFFQTAQWWETLCLEGKEMYVEFWKICFVLVKIMYGLFSHKLRCFHSPFTVPTSSLYISYRTSNV